MLDNFLLMLFAWIVEALGVALMSKGLHEVRAAARRAGDTMVATTWRGLGNRNILLGVVLQTAFFSAFVVLLAQMDMSVVWPLTSLGLVISTLAAKFVLHEHVSALRWAGVLLIVFGATMVGWSEMSASAAADRITNVPGRIAGSADGWNGRDLREAAVYRMNKVR